mgnify:CR=1 FL=1
MESSSGKILSHHTPVAFLVKASRQDMRIRPVAAERKLSRPGVGWVYVALGAGLALGGLKELRDQRW